VNTPEEALACVPVNVMAVGFDINAHRLVYDPAFAAALKERCVKTLDHEEHAFRCEMLKIGREQDLKYRAERFGFRYEL
jgi:hypothetical protein